MDVERDFSAYELCIALCILICAIAFSFVVEAREVDVVGDAVEESRGLQAHIVGGIVKAQVALQAVFWMELAVAKGKKLYDKRADIAKRDSERDMDRSRKERRYD